jgi:hypothetical protein
VWRLSLAGERGVLGDQARHRLIRRSHLQNGALAGRFLETAVLETESYTLFTTIYVAGGFAVLLTSLAFAVVWHSHKTTMVAKLAHILSCCHVSVSV